MKKDIKYAAAVESEAQTLETIKAASAAHDVHGSAATEFDPSSSDGLEHLRQQHMKDLRIQIHGIQVQMRTIENAASGLDSEEKEKNYESLKRRRQILLATLGELMAEDNLTTKDSSSRGIKKLTKDFSNLDLSSSSSSESSQDSPSDEDSSYSSDPSNSSFSDSDTEVQDHKRRKDHGRMLYDGLIYKKDKIGNYIPYIDLRNKSKKFYVDIVGKDIGFKLSTVEEFPRWCHAIEKFSRRNGLDNIVNMKSKRRLHPTENLLLHHILESTVGTTLKHYFDDDTDVIKSFKYIKLEYQGRYSVEKREAEWSNILIDMNCPRIREANQVLTKMVYSERYGNSSETKYRNTNHFINKKILQTLTRDLRYQIRYGKHELLKKKYDRVKPMDLVNRIILFLTEDESIDSTIHYPCGKCESNLHITSSCKKGKRGATQARPSSKLQLFEQSIVSQNSGGSPGKEKFNNKTNKSGKEGRPDSAKGRFQ